MDDGTLARTRGADQGGGLAGLEAQAQSIQGISFGARVAQLDSFEFDLTATLIQALLSQILLGGHVQQFEAAARDHHGTGDRLRQIAEVAQSGSQQQQRRHEGREVFDPGMGFARLQQGQADDH